MHPPRLVHVIKSLGALLYDFRNVKGESFVAGSKNNLHVLLGVQLHCQVRSLAIQLEFVNTNHVRVLQAVGDIEFMLQLPDLMFVLPQILPQDLQTITFVIVLDGFPDRTGVAGADHPSQTIRPDKITYFGHEVGLEGLVMERLWATG